MKLIGIILAIFSALARAEGGVSSGLQTQMGTAMMGMMAASHMQRRNARSEKDPHRKSDREGQADALLITAISLALVGGVTGAVLGSAAIDASATRAAARESAAASIAQSKSNVRIAEIQAHTTVQSKAIEATAALALEKEKRFGELSRLLGKQ